MSRLRLATAVLLTSLAACSPVTNECKRGTLFVNVTLSGAAIDADQLDVAIALDGGAAKHSLLSHTAGKQMGGVQVDFPQGYPTGKSITITIVALKSGATLATGSDTKPLTGACTSVALALAGAEPDLRVNQDLVRTDLAVGTEPDLAVVIDDLGDESDLPIVDDLSIPPDDLSTPTDFTGVTLDLIVRDFLPPADLKPQGGDMVVVPAQLQWQVGSASPTPPNPDNYGSTNSNVMHTYTLKNVGTGTSSSVVAFLDGTNPDKWTASTTCGPPLAPNATCTFDATFLAGNNNQTAGSYTALVRATATNGGQATQTINGTAAYNWVESINYGTHYAAGFGSTYPNGPLGGSCSTKGSLQDSNALI